MVRGKMTSLGMENNEDIPLNEQALRYLNKAKDGYEATIEEFGLESRETAIWRTEIHLRIEIWDRRIQWSNVKNAQNDIELIRGYLAHIGNNLGHLDMVAREIKKN